VIKIRPKSPHPSRQNSNQLRLSYDFSNYPEKAEKIISFSVIKEALVPLIYKIADYETEIILRNCPKIYTV